MKIVILKQKIAKVLMMVALIALVTEIIYPATALALTSGPQQPEFSSFEPIGVSEMVDLFSGDFSYNIPLMDVGGYPLNIAYRSGIGMDQEASWVGLGWNINVGTITRNLQGLPDDFKGDLVEQEMNMKPNRTYALNGKLDLEVFGLGKDEVVNEETGEKKDAKFKGFVSAGVFYNNYTGFGYSIGPQLGINTNKMNADIGLDFNSQSGINPSFDASLNFDRNNSKKLTDIKSITTSIGTGFNTRDGLYGLTLKNDFRDHAITENSDHRTRKTFGKKGNIYAGISNPLNGGASLSFAQDAYTPVISQPLCNFSINFHYNTGTEIVGSEPNLALNGSYSVNWIRNSDKEKTLAAYGYMNYESSPAKEDNEVMMDFNREKDGPLTKEMSNLAIPKATHDLFTVSGQGIGGMFRARRGDVGIVFDTRTKSYNLPPATLGLEAASGNGFKLGTDLTPVFTLNNSGKWNDKGNSIAERVDFYGINDFTPSDPLYEPYYLKVAGEKSAVDQDFHSKIGNTGPLSVEFSNGLLTRPQTAYRFKNKWDGNVDVNEKVRREKRDKRNQAITMLTAAEVIIPQVDLLVEEDEQEHSLVGLEKYIKSYKTDVNGIPNPGLQPDHIPRVGEHSDGIDRKPHHISEITGITPDGMRYVYGIPAYNKKQVEASFNVNRTGNNPNCATGLVNYVAGEDNSKGNTNGIDHFYNKTTLPPFTHSYLLTGVLSPDYSDIDVEEGPSDGDYGTWVKFNYQRVYSDFKWRTPFNYNADQAMYNEGLKSDPLDDKASYVYGEKEVWYTHSIISKTHVALFYISNREDAHGVSGENGGIDVNRPLQQLDKIVLFSKCDFEENGALEAIPIKTVHFDYDYSLCGNVPNNSGDQVMVNGINVNANKGKLTLKKIYFTYGKESQKSAFSPYVFHYADLDHDNVQDANYPYDVKGYDRWGNYKPNLATGCDIETSPLSNADDPYVKQDPDYDGDGIIEDGEGGSTTEDVELRNQHAAAWNLTSIDLPSGGTINVDYEADCYAHVQDRRAMQMMKIMGTYSAPAYTGDSKNNRLYEVKGDSRDYIFFDLDEELNNHNELRDKYFYDPSMPPGERDIRDKYLYYRFLVNIADVKTGSGTEPKYEYVTGYLKIEAYGLDPNDHTRAWIKVRREGMKDNGKGAKIANPISRDAWIFARKNLSKYVYPGSDMKGSDEKTMLKLVGMFGDISKYIVGINRKLRRNDFGAKFIPEKSWVRLYNPRYCKYGGGSRVAKITISDNWADMTNDTRDGITGGLPSKAYGQEYDYTTTEVVNGQETVISSGVASYEPMIGGDENPFRELAKEYQHKKLLAPNEHYSVEGPQGESFLQSPVVGYSKVTVKDIKDEAAVKRTGTGYVEHHFYTARDFPSIFDQTPIKFDTRRPDPLSFLLNVRKVNKTVASQGYVIEMNDMHGKPKAKWVFPEGCNGKPVSGVEYFYKTDPQNKKRLSNLVTVVEKDGAVAQKNIGMDIDFVADMRESISETYKAGLAVNADAFWAIVAVAIPTGYPKFQSNIKKTNIAVTTKVVQRYGLLEKVVAHDLGSSVQTINKTFDAETGEVLLTETINNFNDPVYNFVYPAHWAYDGMSGAFNNIGAEFGLVGFIPGEDGKLAISNPGNYFTPGDELLADGTNKWWVYDVVDDPAGDYILVIDETGAFVTADAAVHYIKITRSGKRNLQSTPVGTIACLKDPSTGSNINNFSEIIDAGAVTFSDQWQYFCHCFGVADATGGNYTVNPFVFGVRGNWRGKKSWLHLTDRAQLSERENTNIRKDGTYEAFSPFWDPPVSTSNWTSSETNWTWTSEVTMVSPYGFELENVDALGRYSSALYGYNNSLPIAVASNARYSEIGFDNFETTFCGDNCSSSHFSFIGTIDDGQSHTGRKSIRVGAGETVSMSGYINNCGEIAF